MARQPITRDSLLQLELLDGTEVHLTFPAHVSEDFIATTAEAIFEANEVVNTRIFYNGNEPERRRMARA